MGEPICIKDLAEQMVRFSGLSLRDAQNPNAEIAITCSGLRPGEKLFEEPLIHAESEPTEHSRSSAPRKNSVGIVQGVKPLFLTQKVRLTKDKIALST